MTEVNSKPNWLFRGLIVISLLVHTAIFMHIASLYRPQAVSYIELTMRSVVKPHTRDIPEPISSKARPPLLDDIQPQDIRPQESPRVPPLPSVLPAPAWAPPAPEVPDVKIAEWQPPAGPVATPVEQKVAAAPPPSSPAAAGQPPEVTREQYRTIVTRSIVDRIGNNYPVRAKKRNQQGRVVVSIDVGADGRIVDLEIVQSSGYRVLDRFVIREVKAAAPFARPPAGPVTVVVPIRFQLQ